MNYLQTQASNPYNSVWVSASAGTGKTKILTDRVLRLLINGTKFSKILCLTFTNEAANEMLRRINNKLLKWATEYDDEDLNKELHNLLGKSPNSKELLISKTLYKNLLDAQDTINISTIHSFCFKVLKRFPIESSISPKFQIVDNISQNIILEQIINDLFLDQKHKDLINFLVINFHEKYIKKLFYELIHNYTKFKIFFQKNLIYKYDEIIDLDEIIYDTKKELHAYINYSYQDHDSIDIEQIFQFFLKKDGNKKLTLNKLKLNSKSQKLDKKILVLQDKIYNINQICKMNKVLSFTKKIIQLSEIFITKYDTYKKNNFILDYDDLIDKTYNLLTQADSKDWILYKLDGGIDHLLVDEAQDTSTKQWEIIISLIEEFYSGESANKNNDRSIFIVGDEKQSIFSFQGANINAFNKINTELKNKLKAVNKDFKNIDLNISYRSTQEILTFVYNLFNDIKSVDSSLFKASNIKISSSRVGHIGKVEIWPIVTNKLYTKQSPFWMFKNNYEKVLSAKEKLAKQIVEFIEHYIKNKIVLSSTGLPAEYKDFMILVRTRDEFTKIIVNELKNSNLEINGMDRISLKENLCILDMINIAKFVLNPHNDFNISILLKSPIINMTDNDLEQLINNKDTSLSIWDFLKNQYKYTYVYQELEKIILSYKTINNTNFFYTLIYQLNYKNLLLKANGYENNDAINELLYLSEQYFKTKNNSLQDFIYWFDNNDLEIKRDIESYNKIKIMTVHSAKGLQSPIVILCDTTSLPTNQNIFLWHKMNIPIVINNSENIPQLLKNVKNEEQHKIIQEYLRLLYVAVTRASDHLIICGYKEQNEDLNKLSWYYLMNNTMKNLANIFIDDKKIYTTGCYCTIQTSKNEIIQNTIKHQIHPFDFKKNNLLERNNIIVTKMNNINKYNIKDFMNVSPIKIQEFLEYGKVFHKILEDTFIAKDINKMYYHPYIKTLSKFFQKKIFKSINNLLKNQEFIDLIKYQVLTEVNISSIDNNKRKIRRIDLLAFNKDNLLIIDYKSDVNPQLNPNSINPNYIKQMKSYKDIITRIYPNYNIITKILWLSKGHLTTVI